MKINMKSVFALLSGCALATLLTGCASVLCGSTQSVAIDSRPIGAEVVIYDSNGKVVCEQKTPCVAKLTRRADGYLESASYVILVKKEGFAPVQVPISGTVNRAYFANIMNGGLGFVIDPITGSMWTLSPNAIDANFKGNSEFTFAHDDGLKICLKEEVPQELIGFLEPVQK